MYALACILLVSRLQFFLTRVNDDDQIFLKKGKVTKDTDKIADFALADVTSHTVIHHVLSSV